MSSTESVLAHHLEMFGDGDVEGLMEDYASDALFISESGIHQGYEEIREVYEDLLPEFQGSSVEFTLEEQSAADDYAYIVWSAVTTENEYEFASDTFVVKDGEIVAQTFAAKVSPKR
jgi:ketosteroid isomerase-like protein